MSPKRGPDWLPKLARHKSRACGRVRIPGRGDVYLGAAGCWPATRKNPPPEVVEAYQREMARFTAARSEGRELAPVAAGCTIAELVDAYRRHCRRWYVKRGKVTSQYHLVAAAVRPVRRLFGTTIAADFAARDLKTVRSHMEQSGTVNRETINGHLGRIRRMFGWAVEEEMVPEETWLRLKAVAGLKRGRTTAREGGRVMPVSDEHVEATLPHLPEVVRAMVQVHRLCGMRPEEVCFMRAGDVSEEADGLWRYVVRGDANKLAHKGIPRIVWIGPQAQNILLPWLAAARATGAPDAWVFPKRRGRGPIVPMHYWFLVKKACLAAGVPRWRPGQLRHSAATAIRQRHGIEGVQATLGHSQVETSQIYAERSEELARRVARESG